MSIRLDSVEELGGLYATLMTEIKYRTGFILTAVNDSFPMSRIARFEFCYLQLRKICELIALACLTAHGDMPEASTKPLQKKYDADKIIKRLGALRPSFYPVPSKQRIDPVTKQPVEIIDIKDGYLSKTDLLRLYGECGQWLHRGSLKRVLDGLNPDLDFERIRFWVDRIITLLNHHSIKTGDPNILFVILMRDDLDGGVKFFPMTKISPQDGR